MDIRRGDEVPHELEGRRRGIDLGDELATP